MKKKFVILILFFSFAALSTLGVTYRYFSLMVLTGKEYKSPGIEIERGPILDRNGNILAIQTNLFKISAIMRDLRNPQKTAECLAGILELDYSEIMEKFESGRNYILIQTVDMVTADKIREAIRENGLRGISISPAYGRNYPEKDLASHLIGFVGVRDESLADTENRGLAGMELQMDDWLYPRNQKPLTSEDKVYGNKVYLTIDLNIQRFAHQASLDIVEKFGADDGVITLVADAKTGEILAYVSLPEINLNNYTKIDNDDPAKINRPVAYTYEPGSVFKVFSVCSFLHLPEGIKKESRFFCDGFYRDSNGRPIIKCTGKHGDIDTGDIIRYSCNTVCYASESVNEESFHYMIKQFGFGDKTGVEVPKEEPGKIDDFNRWNSRSKPTFSMGQGLSVNAMQIIRAATAITNHGTMLQPYLVSKVTDERGITVLEKGRREVNKVVSPSVADEMLLMMERATNDRGTARRIGVEGVRVSAKTGTAEVFDPAEGKYSDSKYTASCLAIFPTEDPKYIVYNVVFTPSKTDINTGAGISVPAVGKIINDIISYKGMKREGDLRIEYSEPTVFRSVNYSVGDIVPDFTGASKKHLLSLFEDERFNIRIQGEGWVYSQNPPPGTPVTEGMTLEFRLK